MKWNQTNKKKKQTNKPKWHESKYVQNLCQPLFYFLFQSVTYLLNFESLAN